MAKSKKAANKTRTKVKKTKTKKLSKAKVAKGKAAVRRIAAKSKASKGKVTKTKSVKATGMNAGIASELTFIKKTLARMTVTLDTLERTILGQPAIAAPNADTSLAAFTDTAASEASETDTEQHETTKDEASQALKQVSAIHGIDAVHAVLKKFDAETLGAIDPSRYHAFVEACTQAAV